MVFSLTVPPRFQYQNEKACSSNEAFFYFSCFHFSAENQEDHLKKTSLCDDSDDVGDENDDTNADDDI